MDKVPRVIFHRQYDQPVTSYLPPPRCTYVRLRHVFAGNTLILARFPDRIASYRATLEPATSTCKTLAESHPERIREAKVSLH